MASIWYGEAIISPLLVDLRVYCDEETGVGSGGCLSRYFLAALPVTYVVRSWRNGCVASTRAARCIL